MTPLVTRSSPYPRLFGIAEVFEEVAASYLSKRLGTLALMVSSQQDQRPRPPRGDLAACILGTRCLYPKYM